MQRFFTLLFPFLLSANLANAQLFVDTSYTVEQMVFGFFNNNGVSISNLNYTGAPAALAFFEGSQSNIGLNAGLLITTGNAENAIGPNDTESSTGNLQVPGSSYLDALIPGYTTLDAAVIELDLVPTTDTLCFRYVFASEEYQEYVGTSFNDIFAFFIEGPGYSTSDSIYVQPSTYISFDSCVICVDTFLVQTDTFCYFDSTLMQLICNEYSDTLLVWCYTDPNCEPDTITYPGYWYQSPGGTNIAQIPTTNLPVAINNLNQFAYAQYYNSNAGGLTVQYDGFTVPLWAKAVVTPGESYHIRIAIADAGDAAFDSGVFLSIESIGGDSLLPVEPAFITQPGPDQRTFYFDNQTLWATQWHWDFGDGFISEERNPTHSYTQDGNYQVNLTASNWCSQETTTYALAVGTTGTQAAPEAIFKIAPNPTNGAVNVQLLDSETATLRLWNLDGRLLVEQQVQQSARLSLDDFNPGVYILQVFTENGIFSQKIIRN
ncbi:MAG: choice-of-anchor L domain-containing protein [Chitinophagales bacterium]|jgi:hypothetical protein